MEFSKNALSILAFWMVSFFIAQSFQAQTKKIKRTNNGVGISSVDKVAFESFQVNNNLKKYRIRTQVEDESVLVGDNTFFDGKAENRRVEFIKI